MIQRQLRLASFSFATALTIVVHSAEQQLPLEAEELEVLEFETDRVTWLSLDVNQDGSQFILEVLGDLYTLPIEGGNASQLTSGIAFDTQPIYSPDGTKIAFLSDRDGQENVWIMDADGTNAQRLSDLNNRALVASPNWAPDGSHVIASVTSWGLRTHEVWAYSLHGGKGLKLTTSKANKSTPSSQRHNALGASYDASGRYLFFARKTGGFGYNLRFPLWQITKRDLVDDADVQLTHAVGSAFRPVLSNDGKHLVYGTRFNTRTGLRIRHLETGKDKWLAYPVQRDEQESTFTRDLLPGMAFSPDDSEFYFTHQGQIKRVNVESGGIDPVPFTIPVKLAHNRLVRHPYRIGFGPVNAKLARFASMGPDGAQIAFGALGRIYVRELSSDAQIQLTDGEEMAAQPSWSEDGRNLTYVTWADQGGHVWRVQPKAGRNPVQVTKDAAFYSYPIWDRTGDRIFAIRSNTYERETVSWDSGVGTGAELVSIDAKTGSVSRLRPLSSQASELAFGPDPERIYVHLSGGVFGNTSASLVSYRIDGSDERKHLSLRGPGIYRDEEAVSASSLRLSPDGNHALGIHANQLYLLRTLGQNAKPINITLVNSPIPLYRLTDVGADHAGFSADGKSVFWTVGSTLYTRELATVDFNQRSKSNKPDPAQESGDSDQSTSKPSSDLREEDDHVVKTELRVYEPRHEPESTFILRDVAVISMMEGQTPIWEQTDILVVNNRIEAIGSALNAPRGAKEFVYSNKYIVPGYVDTHAHIPIKRNVIGPDTWPFAANLAYGVTTLLDVQPSTIDLLEYGDLVAMGDIPGPRVLTTGPGVFSNQAFRSQEHANNVLQRYRDHYGVRNIKAYISGNRKQRHWTIKASDKHQLNTTTEGALDLKRDITHALDGFAGNEHNLPVVGQYKDVSYLYAATKIGYTPTLLVAFGGPSAWTYFATEESPRGDSKLARFTPPWTLDARLLRQPIWVHPDEQVFSKHAAQAHDIVTSGGLVGVGSHGELQGLGYHWELWALHSGGFSNYEALRAATLDAAKIVGVQEDVGSIEVGKLADMVVLNSNPLDDIRNSADLEYVIKNGEIFDASNLDRVWPAPAVNPPPSWTRHLPPAP